MLELLKRESLINRVARVLEAAVRRGSGVGGCRASAGFASSCMCRA